MASCNRCGRQAEVSDSGQSMPCVPECQNANDRPLDAFLRYAVDTCVNPRPSLEVEDEGATCKRCGANWRLEGPCDECEAYERDRKLCMDQDDDKEYRKGLR